MGTLLYPSLSCVLFITGAAMLSSAQMEAPAHVPEPVLTAIAGRPANITCESFGNPISLCIWEKFNPDKTKPSALSSYMEGGKNASTWPGFFHYGDLQSGICGLHATNITRVDNSNWQCTLFSESNVYRGLVEIKVVNKPDPPRFIPSELGELIDGETVGTGGAALACYSAYGLPPPKFRWFLGNETYKGELFPVNTTEDSEGNTYTYQQLRNQHFDWKDNGKNVRCIIAHEMITDQDVSEAVLPLNIKYKPRSEQNSLNELFPEIGSRFNLTYNFYANPKPWIYWEVDGVRISAGFSSPDRRIEALHLEEVGPFSWRAILRIQNTKRADLKRKYILKTENDVGRQDFEICLTQTASRQGALCSSQALFLQVRPTQPPTAQPTPRPATTRAPEIEKEEEEDQEIEDENENDEDARDSMSANNVPSRLVLERLGEIKHQMQTLREQEARLQSQLHRVKSPKSVEEKDETTPDTLTTVPTVSSTLAGPKSRNGRQFGLNSRPTGKPIILHSPPSTNPSAFSEFSEVKVESAGIFIRKKNP